MRAILNDGQRRQMIAETSEFLSWALNEDANLPRIPRRAVREGGFSMLLAQPGARAAIVRWWDRVFDRISELT